jgi:starch phosphorylase
MARPEWAVEAVKAEDYDPMEHYHANPELREVMNRITGGYFCRGDTELCKPLTDGLLHAAPYFLLADYQSYVDCQAQVDQAYRDRDHWTRMAILNPVRSGKSSSDRTIRE